MNSNVRIHRTAKPVRNKHLGFDLKHAHGDGTNRSRPRVVSFAAESVPAASTERRQLPLWSDSSPRRTKAALLWFVSDAGSGFSSCQQVTSDFCVCETEQQQQQSASARLQAVTESETIIWVKPQLGFLCPQAANRPPRCSRSAFLKQQVPASSVRVLCRRSSRARARPAYRHVAAPLLVRSEG